MKASIVLLFLFLTALPLFILAQTNTDTTLVRIQTIDGNEFVGTISGQDSVKITLLTKNLGEISIAKSDIKLQEQVYAHQLKDGKLWFANPQATRYFWAPNGYGLKQGEGYYQNIYVLWNQVSYGITDNFSLGGGVIPLFLFAGGPTPVFLTPKFSIPIEKDKWNIGGGALVGTIIGEDFGSFGLVYGLSTFGTRDKNVSIGIGYGFADGEWAKRPLINFSSLLRISSRGYFITENYFISFDDGGAVVLGLGGRWLIKRASLDFMFGIPISSDMDFIAFPVIGFSIPFGDTN